MNDDGGHEERVQRDQKRYDGRESAALAAKTLPEPRSGHLASCQADPAIDLHAKDRVRNVQRDVDTGAHVRHVDEHVIGDSLI